MTNLKELQEKLKKIFQAANPVRNFQQGVQQAQTYFNPTSNQGNNFWSTPTAQNISNVQRGVQQGIQNVKQSDPFSYTPFSMKSNVVQDARTVGKAFGKQQLGEDIGYGLRGALNVTPFQAIKPMTRQYEQQKQSNPQTFRQQAAQSIGQGIYGSALTAPIAGGAAGIARNAIVGTGLGVGMGVGSDLLTGKGLPNKQRLTEQALAGFQNSWILPITNSITDKILSGFAPQLVGKNVINPFVSGEVKEGLKRVFLRALSEVPMENTAFTWLGRIDDKSKETFVKDWLLNLPGNIVSNLAFAGVQSGGNIIKNKESRQAVEQALQNTLRKWNTPVTTMELDASGKRISMPMWQYKMKNQPLGGSVQDLSKLTPEDYKKATGKEAPDAISKGSKTIPQVSEELLGGKIKGLKPSSEAQSKSLLLKQPFQTEQKVQLKAKQSSDTIISQAKKEIGNISDEKPKSLKQTADEIYTQWIDRYNPITKASKFAKEQLKIKGVELRPEYDPAILVRKLTGAGGIADARFQKELKPIIDQLDEFKIDKGDMDVYLKARRDIGLSKRDIKGSDLGTATTRMSALEQKYGENIKGLAQQLYDYQNKGFQEMIDAGFISPEVGKTIRSQNPDYVPFDRVMDEVDNYLGLPTRKTMQGTQPIKKIKGSIKKIYSPIESVIANTFKQRAAIEKNNVAKAIVGLQKIAPDLGFNKVSTAGDNAITIWNNGTKEFWNVGNDIAATAKGLNEENMNGLLKIFTAPASLLRQGATGRNPEFMIPNVVRDQLDAGITSKYGYIPFVDYISGLKSMISNDEIYQKWQNSGAKIDLGSMSGRKSIQHSFDDKAARKGLFTWLSKGLDIMGKYSEQPTRVGLFKKAYQKTGNELLAMMESREATVDFARMGSKMRVANSIIPFLNVRIQGFDKLIRSVKDHPGKVALNAGMYAALPAITTTLYNLANYAEEYSEIPQYEKNSNFVLVNGRNENGTVDYITLPKGNIIPVIANPIESFLSFMAGQDQQTLGEFATQFISSTLPVLGEGQSLKEVALKTVGGNLPQLIKPITENLVNKSFWKYDTKKEQSKEITPYYLQTKEPYKQSYEWTPKMYKGIGSLLNVSPLKVQNLMEGYLAGYSKVPAQIIDMLVKSSKGEKIEPNEKTLLRRFIKTTYPSSATPAKETEKTPLMERITGKVSASGGLELPNDLDSLEVIYKDVNRTVSSYKENKVKALAGLVSKDLSVYQEEFDQANKIKKQIETEHPDKVFEIQTNVYKSGEGQSVEDRASWVETQLKGLEGKERQDLIKKLWDAKVITSGSKGVAAKLREMGIEVGRSSKGKKGKKGAKVTFKTTKPAKITFAKSTAKMPKLSLPSSPKIKLKTVRAKPSAKLNVKSNIGTIKAKPLPKITIVKY